MRNVFIERSTAYRALATKPRPGDVDSNTLAMDRCVEKRFLTFTKPYEIRLIAFRTVLGVGVNTAMNPVIVLEFFDFQDCVLKKIQDVVGHYLALQFFNICDLLTKISKIHRYRVPDDIQV